MTYPKMTIGHFALRARYSMFIYKDNIHSDLALYFVFTVIKDYSVITVFWTMCNNISSALCLCNI